MALKVYLDDGCKAETSCVFSLLRRKRQGWSQSKSLGNSPLWDFIEFLQTGWWWAWRCSMHQVTHEFCELQDGVCPTASTDCQNRGDSTSHQKQCGILLCTRKKKSTQKMGILNMLRHGCFANLISPFSFHTQILTKSTQLFQMFWFLSAEPIPTEYGPVKTSPRRFHVESGLCCTAVKVRQEEGTCCKSATSWQLSGCKSFYSKAPGVTLLFKWPCENLLAFNSEKSMIYHQGIHRFAQEWETMHVCFSWFITAKKYTFSEAGKYI